MFEIFYCELELFDDEIYLKLDKVQSENLKKGYVPSYHFKIFRVLGNKELGICDLRIGHNKNTFYGGNIGYFIDEKYRGHNYAGKASLLLFKLALKHNMDYLLVTCSTQNIASIKTIQYIGGEFTDLLYIPCDHEMYKEGIIKVFQYKVNLLRNNFV